MDPATPIPALAVSRSAFLRSVKKKTTNKKSVKRVNVPETCGQTMNHSLMPWTHVVSTVNKEKKGKEKLRSICKDPISPKNEEGGENLQNENANLSTSLKLLSSSDESDEEAKKTPEKKVSTLRQHINNIIKSDEDSDDMVTKEPTKIIRRRCRISRHSKLVVGVRERGRITTYDNILQMFVGKSNEVDDEYLMDSDKIDLNYCVTSAGSSQVITPSDAKIQKEF